MRNGAFGCSNVIVRYCCSWAGLANVSARGMKQSLSCCGCAFCHHTQEMCLFTVKLLDGARRVLTKKSLCRHYFPHGNSGLGIFSMDDQVLVSSIKTAHPGSLPDYSSFRASVARLSFLGICAWISSLQLLGSTPKTLPAEKRRRL